MNYIIIVFKFFLYKRAEEVVIVVIKKLNCLLEFNSFTIGIILCTSPKLAA